METFSALLAFCAGSSPAIGDFPGQRPVTWNFDVFFVLHLNKRLSKQSPRRWFETPSDPLWRHCNTPRGHWVDRKKHVRLRWGSYIGVKHFHALWGQGNRILRRAFYWMVWAWAITSKTLGFAYINEIWIKSSCYILLAFSWYSTDFNITIRISKIRSNHFWERIVKRQDMVSHDDVIKWKHFPHNWSFVRGIHRGPVNSPHKG